MSEITDLLLRNSWPEFASRFENVLSDQKIHMTSQEAFRCFILAMVLNIFRSPVHLRHALDRAYVASTPDFVFFVAVVTQNMEIKLNPGKTSVSLQTQEQLLRSIYFTVSASTSTAVATRTATSIGERLEVFVFNLAAADDQNPMLSDMAMRTLVAMLVADGHGRLLHKGKLPLVHMIEFWKGAKYEVRTIYYRPKFPNNYT